MEGCSGHPSCACPEPLVGFGIRFDFIAILQMMIRESENKIQPEFLSLPENVINNLFCFISKEQQSERFFPSAFVFSYVFPPMSDLECHTRLPSVSSSNSSASLDEQSRARPSPNVSFPHSSTLSLPSRPQVDGWKMSTRPKRMESCPFPPAFPRCHRISLLYIYMYN